MSRVLFLALVATAAWSALAQNVYRYVGPDGRVTYSDTPPSTGSYTNVQPGGVQAPGTIQQAPLPNQPLPTANLPSGSGPSVIPSSAVPAPGSFESTPGRAPNTGGDRLIGVPADAQRIDQDAAQRNMMQGERAREAEAVRLNVEPGEAARMRRDLQTNVPAGEAARERRDMQIGVPADEAAREREAVRLNQ